MKAKVILYGWVISWIFLFAGIGTMEYGNEPEGSLLCAVWFVFSLFLIGNEANGLKDETADMADCYIKIPMKGQVESLNAAVASSVLLFEAAKQNK